ncbi:MAG: hypothetical protein U0350_02740 [Caldilineaceae bacterium]
MFFIQDLKGSNGTKAGFKFDFYNEVQQLGRHTEGQLRTSVEKRLGQLTSGYRELAKASIALEQPLQKEFADLYQASVIVYIQPDKISVIAREVTPEGALQAALKTVERQVYERCTKQKHQAQASDWFNVYKGKLWHGLQKALIKRLHLRKITKARSF